MRKFMKIGAFVCASAMLLNSCSKDVKGTQTAAPTVVSQEVLLKIAALGFSTNNVQKIDEGYLVEGDIILTTAKLNEKQTSPNLRFAEAEQYNTFNLVTGLPRTITITTSGKNITTRLSDGINGAIARYNAENLQIHFVRGGSNGGSGGSNINIRVVNSGQFIASSGFPTGGNPYFEVQYARTYNGYALGFVTSVIAHEVGHCIGFRHTDWMSRQYSCGGAATNEGQQTTGVGAVLIPGTPAGPEAGSWMLACLSATTDRPFTGNDKTALNYIY